MAQQSSLISILKISSIILALVIATLLLLFIIFGLYRTYVVEHRANQKTFRAGNVPEPLPDDFYKGNKFTGFGASWQGKVFDRANKTGINQFTDGQRFVFTTYPSKGLRDKDRQILRIDYNQPDNPWWLHFIVDEIVETEPEHYLGKVHLQVIPGLPFTLTYFELQK